MYNRYIRNDQGTYTRIPEEEQRSDRRQEQRNQEGRPSPPPPRQEQSHRPEAADTITRTLRSLLDRLHLESVDTGDLLLLVLLFLLYEEHADEEILFALGILLIL